MAQTIAQISTNVVPPKSPSVPSPPPETPLQSLLMPTMPPQSFCHCPHPLAINGASDKFAPYHHEFPATPVAAPPSAETAMPATTSAETDHRPQSPSFAHSSAFVVPNASTTAAPTTHQISNAAKQAMLHQITAVSYNWEEAHAINANFPPNVANLIAAATHQAKYPAKAIPSKQLVPHGVKWVVANHSP